MKRAIPFILALVVCISLCACADNHSNTTTPTEEVFSVSGKWLALNSDISITFIDDASCLLYMNEKEIRIPYEYDADKHIIVLYDSTTVNLSINERNGITVLTNSVYDFVEEANYETAINQIPANKEEQTEDGKSAQIERLTNEFVEGKSPLAFNTPYKLGENTEITFCAFEVLDCSGTELNLNITNEDYYIRFSVRIKNILTDKQVSLSDGLMHNTMCHGDAVVLMPDGITWSEDGLMIPRGEEVDGFVTGIKIQPESEIECYVYYRLSKDSILASMEVNNPPIGFIAFTFDGQQYYMRLADIFANYELN